MEHTISAKNKAHSEEEMKKVMALLEEISDEPWDRMAALKRNKLSALIGDDEKKLGYAVITINEMADVIRGILMDLRDTRRSEEANGVKYNRAEELNYTHTFLVMHAIMKTLREYADEDGEAFVHLCDKGCKAVRYRMSHEKE